MHTLFIDTVKSEAFLRLSSRSEDDETDMEIALEIEEAAKARTQYMLLQLR